MAAAVHDGAGFLDSFESIGPITPDSTDLNSFTSSGLKKHGEPQKRSTRVTIAETMAAEIASDGVPEAPRSSLPVHPSGIWDTAGNHELVEVLTAQHTEVISRLTAQEEILRRVLMPDAHGKEVGLVSGDNEQMVGLASLCPHPSVSKQTMRSTRSTQRSSRHASRDSEVKPRASTSPRFFRTFTQIDSSLRYAASAITATRARRRFASLRWRGESSEDVNASCIERIVEAVSFDCFFAVLVLLNCAFIGIEVQHAIEQPDSTPVEFYVVQYSLAFMFTLELFMRLCASGCREFFCGEDWLWSLLDAFIVVSSIWDIALDLIFLWDASSTGAANPDNPVSSLRALRILRLARIVKAVRLMRVFRFVRALRTLISSIFHTLKSLFWALMLMVLIVYVFGVLFSQAVNIYLVDPENPPMPDMAFEAAQRHYDSLWGTMVSLFMCISGGTNWENVLAPLRAISQLWELLFLFYVSFTYFAVLNVVTAVFCQSAIESAQNDQASLVQNILEEKEEHREKLLDLFVKVGDEQDTITFEMFQEKINDPAVRNYFTSIGLDVWDAWSFFKLLDLDEGGSVEADEFLMGCLRLRGQARAVDVGKIIHDQTWLIRNQSHFQGYVEVQLRQMSQLLSRLTGVRLQSVHLLQTSQP